MKRCTPILPVACIPVACILVFLLGCKKGDAQPQATHSVEVRFQATSIPTNYQGNFYVEEDNGSGATTTYLDTPSGTKSYIHKANIAKVAGNTVYAKVALYPTTSSNTSIVTTSLKADIVVDGAIKSSIAVNTNTTPKTSGTREVSAFYTLQ